MQDKYAGDVGDFGKFVLLDQLIRASNNCLRLGINWYRVTRPERNNADGRHISYLSKSNPMAERFERCDPFIYSSLKGMVDRSDRSIRTLEQSGLLPKDTLFFSDALPYGAHPLDRRITERTCWFAKSSDQLADANIVFLDPDNGIQTRNVRATHTKSIKFALVEEVKQYCLHHQIVILYNHRDHSPEARYKERFLALHKEVGRSTQLRIIRFRRVSVRDFAFLFKSEMTPVVNSLFEVLGKGPHNFLFEEFIP